MFRVGNGDLVAGLVDPNDKSRSRVNHLIQQLQIGFRTSSDRVAYGLAELEIAAAAGAIEAIFISPDAQIQPQWQSSLPSMCQATQASNGLVVLVRCGTLPMLEQVCGVAALLRFCVIYSDRLVLDDQVALPPPTKPDPLPRSSTVAPCRPAPTSFPTESQLHERFSAEVVEEICALQGMLLESEIHAQFTTTGISLAVSLDEHVKLIVELDGRHPDHFASLDVVGPDLWTNAADVGSVLRAIQNLNRDEPSLLGVYFLAKESLANAG